MLKKVVECFLKISLCSFKKVNISEISWGVQKFYLDFLFRRPKYVISIKKIILWHPVRRILLIKWTLQCCLLIIFFIENGTFCQKKCPSFIWCKNKQIPTFCVLKNASCSTQNFIWIFYSGDRNVSSIKIP